MGSGKLFSYLPRWLLYVNVGDCSSLSKDQMWVLWTSYGNVSLTVPQRLLALAIFDNWLSNEVDVMKTGEWSLPDQ